MDITSLENELFRPDYSEEFYFGITCAFSSEMIGYVTKLREELRILLGAEWRDKTKRTITINRETESKSKESTLSKILDDMGECVSRHCNIEKCYIGLFNDINAHTLPMTFDSSILLDKEKKPIYKRYGELFINNKAVRSDTEIFNSLLKLEDIAINKDGYKFRSPQGKVFIINLGLPILLDELFESSPEECCSILFHEIGHNFQQVLHGTNQMMVQYYTRYYLSMLSTSRFYDIIGFLDSFLINSHLRTIITHVGKSNNTRFSIIKCLLSGSVLVNRDGTLTTRDDLGELERANITKVIQQAKEENQLLKLSIGMRILVTAFSTIGKIFGLIFTPLAFWHRVSLQSNLNKNYHDMIQDNKIYEQFADTFAVSYGFGGVSSKFWINIQQYIKDLKPPTHAGVLNHIPFLSTIDAVNNLNYNTMQRATLGYDDDHVRIAQSYRVLEYELSNNKDLTALQKKEINTHMSIIKEDYDKFNKIELENFGKNPSITKYIMKKYRSGDISSIANESGIVEGVLEVITEYENSGVIKEPPIVAKFKELNGLNSIAVKAGYSLISSFKNFKDYLIKGFNI